MCHKQQTHRQLLRFFADFLLLAFGSWKLALSLSLSLRRSLAVSRGRRKAHLQNHIKIESKCDFICLHCYCLTTNPSHLFFNTDKIHGRTIWQLAISCAISVWTNQFFANFLNTFVSVLVFCDPFSLSSGNSVESNEWVEFSWGQSQSIFGVFCAK